jgi:putative DNA primase/helicase
MTLKDVAKGHWRNLLPQLGVSTEHLTGKHGPCPICGGKDRFRWDNQGDHGAYYCSACGPGDGFDLAAKVSGLSFRQVAEKIEGLLGKPSQMPIQKPDFNEMAHRTAMERAWDAARQPSEMSPVGGYLVHRVGCLWPSKMIREHSGYWTEGELRPAMVSKIASPEGRAVNLHLTFLTNQGQKARVEVGKKVMPGKLPDGSAIRLAPAGPAMGVAEGIESAISAAILFNIPVWACVNGVMLSKWVPPDVAEEIIVFGDNDRNYTGQSKAYQLANRLEVQFKRHVSVMIPTMTDQDWNDVHREHLGLGHLRVVK